MAFATVIPAFAPEIVDATIVNTASPTIQRGLSAGDSATQWVAAGYFLSFAVLLVAGGRLGHLFGYRRLFLAGVAGFTTASLLCGLAPSAEALIAARAAQGAAAAMVGPQVIALVQLLYSPLERVARLATFGAALLGTAGIATAPRTRTATAIMTATTAMIAAGGAIATIAMAGMIAGGAVIVAGGTGIVAGSPPEPGRVPDQAQLLRPRVALFPHPPMSRKRNDHVAVIHVGAA